jgi:hypothetical protein
VSDVLQRSPAKLPTSLDNWPYQEGYIDFTSWSQALKEDIGLQKSGPSRKSAYDDVLYYLSQWVVDSQAKPTPEVPAMIVKKLALSHTVALIEYIKSILSNVEDGIRRSGHKIESFGWLESTLGELFAWNRRVSDYCDHTEAALDSLHISPNESQNITATESNWNRYEEDFRYVHRRMASLKKRTNDLISSVNGLIGILETKRSLDEAKGVRTLTIVGMLFLPLSFTTGLLSMDQDYSPGGSHFWVFWAIAVPLISLCFFGAYLVGGLKNR